MQVHIQMSLPGSSTAEWVLVELQGDLESRTEDAVRGKFIGDLNFTKKGVPTLIIGHHILYGKVVNMEKPYVALRKNTESQCEESVEYLVEGVIKKKLLFRSRPKPIIINSSKLL